MAPEDEPITIWIGSVKAGDGEAANRIWRHYSPQVVALARTRLPIWLRRIVDDDDIASSAVRAVIMDLRAGKLPDLNNRADLCSLLACITVCRSINQIKSGRCKKRIPPEAMISLEDWAGGIAYNADLPLEAAQRFQLLIDCLRGKDELLATMALGKFEGYTSAEIARRLGSSRWRVARKLDLIPMTWEEEGLR